MVNDLLLIDIGNSFIKYSFAHSETPGVTTPVCYLDNITELHELPANIKQVRLSAVGQTDKFDQLLQMFSEQNVLLAQTRKQAFGIEFAYTDMSKLGVDRWLAMIAARQSYTGNLVVLSLGTAATCDLISVDGLHLGGWIAPGYRTLRQALLANTTQVFSDGHQPTELKLGQNTSNCVDYGCLAMLEGFLLKAQQLLAKQGGENTIIITGGDRHLLAGLKNSQTHWEENLVLKGLSYL